MTNDGGGPPHPDTPGEYGDRSDHFDTETLSEHAEGLLEGARDAHVRAHVAWCTECNGVVEQLRSVQSMLSSLPSPPLPDDVAARIDASLAQAQQERADLGRAERPARQRRSWFTGLFTNRLQLLAGAAALVVVMAFVGGYVSTQLGTEGEGDAGPTNQAIPPTGDGPMITGRDYTTTQLAGQVRALVAAKKEQRYTPDPAVSAQLNKEIQRLSDPEELDKCIGALTGGERTRIVAVDLSELDRKPAAIVVMTMANRADKYEVAVAGPDCTAGDAKVMHRQVISRT